MKVRETDSRVSELPLRNVACENVVYCWKLKLGGMEVSDAERLRELEQKNAMLNMLPQERGARR